MVAVVAGVSPPLNYRVDCGGHVGWWRQCAPAPPSRAIFIRLVWRVDAAKLPKPKITKPESEPVETSPEHLKPQTVGVVTVVLRGKGDERGTCPETSAITQGVSVTGQQIDGSIPPDRQVAVGRNEGPVDRGDGQPRGLGVQRLGHAAEVLRPRRVVLRFRRAAPARQPSASVTTRGSRPIRSGSASGQPPRTARWRGSRASGPPKSRGSRRKQRETAASVQNDSNLYSERKRLTLPRKVPGD